MKNSIFTVLFLTVFSPLVCMEVVPCIPPVLPQVLSYCDPSDIGSLLSVNKGFKKMMCSEVGLAYAADIRDKKLFLTLLQKQDRQEQKESHAFLVKMRYLLIELSEDEDSTEMEEEEHLLSLEDASLEEYMKAYRYEVESLDLSDRIRSALAEYNPLLTDAIQTDYKKTIEKYACVRSLNNQRNALISPLDWAILISNKASVDLLLGLNKDAISYLTRDSQTNGFGYLLDTCEVEIVQLLCKRHKNSQEVRQAVLWSAIKRDCCNWIKTVIDMGVDVNMAGPAGKPLLYALSHDKMEVAQYLLKIEGIDVNCQDQKGDTPLHTVVGDAEKSKNFDDNVAIVATLLSKGADVTMQNIKGNTPLHVALALAISYSTTDFFPKYQEIIKLMKEKFPEDKCCSLVNDCKKTVMELEGMLNHWIIRDKKQAERQRQKKEEAEEQRRNEKKEDEEEEELMKRLTKEIQSETKKQVSKTFWNTRILIASLLGVVGVLCWYYFHDYFSKVGVFYE